MVHSTINNNNFVKKKMGVEVEGGGSLVMVMELDGR
jgi:hypothetical protein